MISFVRREEVGIRFWLSLVVLLCFRSALLYATAPRNHCFFVSGIAGRATPPDLSQMKTAGERVGLTRIWLRDRLERIETVYEGNVIDVLGAGSDAAVLLLRLKNGSHIVVKAGSGRTRHEFIVLADIRRQFETSGVPVGNIPEVLKFDASTMSFSMSPISKEHAEGQYVRPRTLLELLKKTPPYFGPEQPERSVEVLAKLKEQVELLHQSGYVHRDLKPSNILIVEQKGHPLQVWLIDFGSSEKLDLRFHPDDPGLLFSNGTNGYVSVNQKFGMPVSYLDDFSPLEQIARDLAAGHPSQTSFFDF